MKRLLILSVAGMLACAGTTFAADPPEKKGPRPSMDQRLEMMAKELDLTADQQAKIKALNDEQAKKRRDAREKVEELTPEQRRERMQAAMKEYDAKMKEILKPEQYAKWEKHRMERVQEGRRAVEEKAGKDGKGKGKKE